MYLVFGLTDDTEQVPIWHEAEHWTKIGKHSCNENTSQNWTAGHGGDFPTKGKRTFELLELLDLREILWWKEYLNL